MEQKKAILFGASGFIGSYLLDELLKSADYAQITVVLRKEIPIHHPKLKILIGDYHSLPRLQEDIVADDVFIALGTTKKKSPDQREYYQIDHDYPVLAAKLAQESGATAVFLVSAVGANADSSIFYIRTKGDTERDIIALNFQRTAIFRPSMLLGNRKENRPLERVLLAVWPVMNFMLLGNSLKKYRGIEGRDVAKAMHAASREQSEKIKVYHWQEMKDMKK